MAFCLRGSPQCEKAWQLSRDFGLFRVFFVCFTPNPQLQVPRTYNKFPPIYGTYRSSDPRVIPHDVYMTCVSRSRPPLPCLLLASCRKVIRRCLQLSLRLSTKLRSLPPDHALQGFCKAATRTYSKYYRYTTGSEPSGSGSGNLEAFPLDAGSQFSSPEDDRRWPSSGGRSGGSKRRKDLRLAVDDGGGTGDGSVWQRYSSVVQEVVSLWCQDVNAFDLDPLWLLPKLRTHTNW